MAREISNSDDVIDSRDVIERQTELADPDLYPLGEMTDDERAEYIALTKLAGEGERELSEWADGVTLIRYTYFEDYARELAGEVASVSTGPSFDRRVVTFAEITEQWPFRHIDWQAAADELHQDYTSIEFDGVTYYGRS